MCHSMNLQKKVIPEIIIFQTFLIFIRVSRWQDFPIELTDGRGNSYRKKDLCSGRIKKEVDPAPPLTLHSLVAHWVREGMFFLEPMIRSCHVGHDSHIANIKTITLFLLHQTIQTNFQFKGCDTIYQINNKLTVQNNSLPLHWAT